MHIDNIEKLMSVYYLSRRLVLETLDNQGTKYVLVQ